MKHLYLTLLPLALCACSYERAEQCDLDALNISGDVTRVETIVQSTIPLTEMFYDVMGTNAICTAGGNISLEIDNHGNVKRYTGYDMEGKKLFDAKGARNSQDGVCAGVLGAEVDKNISDFTIATDSAGRVSDVVYLDNNGEPLWSQHIDYNNHGNIDRIVKRYEQLAHESLSGDMVTPSDTTRYRYINHDNHSNWTEVEVEYIGILPRFRHTYRVMRQLTYHGEHTPSPLIKQLADYNRVAEPQPQVTMNNILLGTWETWGYIDVPAGMVLNARRMAEFNRGPQEYLCVYEHGGGDAYASLSVAVSRDDFSFNPDTTYAPDFDSECHTLMKQSLATGGIYLFKWLPSKVEATGNSKALVFRYYRHGMGSPIPVYVEIRTLQTSLGKMEITFSYQSDQANRFRPQFEQAMASLRVQ